MSKRIYYSLIVFLIFLAIFIRFYRLASLPPSLYWEEVALGYDAYSILKTAHDHHNHYLPLLAFESFGDWKPSLYFYSIIPSIVLFGLNEFAVRVPAAIAGVLIVIFTAKIAALIFINNSRKSFNYQQKITLLTLFITATTPWAVIFSRAAWEVNLATALLIMGLYFALKFLYLNLNQELKLFKTRFLLIACLLILISMYAYHSNRLTAPLLLVIFLVQLFFQKKTYSLLKIWQLFKKNILILVLILFQIFLLTIPLLINLQKTEIKQRFQETSIFYDLKIIEESNHRIAAENCSLLAKIFYHRYLLFFREITTNFFEHFSLNFLFISGDLNPRHSIQDTALFYYSDFFLLLIAIFLLIKKKNPFKFILIAWLIIAILPASISYAHPHALRSLAAMPVFVLLISFALTEIIIFFSKNKKGSFLIILFFFIRMIEILLFFYSAINIYPKKYAQEWQYGYQELITEVNKLVNDYPDNQIYISREAGRPAMYYWFYSETDPRLVQLEDKYVKKDQGEFLDFKNIIFFDQLTEIKSQSILAASPQTIQSLQSGLNIQFETIKIIKNPNQENIWEIILIK